MVVWVRKSLVFFISLCACMPAWSARAAIEAVRLQSEGRDTTLTIALSSSSTWRLFTLSDPDRIVLDVLGAQLDPRALPLPAGAGAVHQVRAANRPDGSVRLVLDMAARAEPEGTMRRDSGSTGNQLVVQLRTAPTPIAPMAPMGPMASTTNVASGDSIPVSSAPARVPATVQSPALPVPPPAPSAVQERGAQTTATNGAQPPAVSRSPAPAPVTAIPRAPARPAARESLPGRDIVIAVDAGHGGKDPGAHGPRGVREKDVTLRLARLLVDVINAEPGMRGVLTRDRDEFVPLRGRMERARAAQADLFVSVHADAVRNRDVKGASIYVLNEKGATDEAARRLAARENAADLIGGVSLRTRDRTLASVLLDLSQSASMSSSIEVAGDILEEMARVGTVRKRQVMQAPFMVLKSPDVPSVLVETAYISNPQEERRLDSHDYRGRLAEAIFRGVRTYFYRNPPHGTLVAELSRQRLGRAAEHVTSPGETLSTIAAR